MQAKLEFVSITDFGSKSNFGPKSDFKIIRCSAKIRFQNRTKTRAKLDSGPQSNPVLKSDG